MSILEGVQMNNIIKVLGHDVGTVNSATSIISINTSTKKITLDYFKYLKLPDISFEEKLLKFEAYFSKVIEKYSPDFISYESPYIKSRNGQQLIMVCGILVLCGAKKSIKSHGYPASTVKKQVSGNGKADKKELEQAVKEHLRLDKNFKFENDHVSDSVAIALTHYFKRDEK